MDIRLKHPFTCIVAGQTQCGKSTFVSSLIKNSSELIDPPPDQVTWCYAEYQAGLEAKLPGVKFQAGLNVDELDYSQRNLVIIDDMMTELGNDKKLANIFTKGSHHKNLSVIFIIQNLFYQAQQMRNISLNAHYLIIFKNVRDKSQIQHLAKQMYPGQTQYLLDAFRMATEKPHGYILIDLKPGTPDNIRLRSCILPEEGNTVVYLPK